VSFGEGELPGWAAAGSLGAMLRGPGRRLGVVVRGFSGGSRRTGALELVEAVQTQPAASSQQPPRQRRCARAPRCLCRSARAVCLSAHQPPAHRRDPVERVVGVSELRGRAEAERERQGDRGLGLARAAVRDLLVPPLVATVVADGFGEVERRADGRPRRQVAQVAVRPADPVEAGSDERCGLLSRIECMKSTAGEPPRVAGVPVVPSEAQRGPARLDPSGSRVAARPSAQRTEGP
jgi:hypothetical protein